MMFTYYHWREELLVVIAEGILEADQLFEHHTGRSVYGGDITVECRSIQRPV